MEGLLAAQDVIDQLDTQPRVGLILGSGLGDLADQIEDAAVFPYRDLQSFPELSVSGHAGQLVVGRLAGKSVVAMQGRSHYYEHCRADLLADPVRYLSKMGVETLIVTNACGGINPDLSPGALMIIEDHINLTGDNPLIGRHKPEDGVRFPDMSDAYAIRLRQLAAQVAIERGIEIRSGVYAAVGGPYYLSRAELGMVRTLGADAIGMSTIPEVIIGTQLGMDILGISCVTDMAIPESLTPLTHDEVIEVANATKPKFSRLILEFIAAL